jgi:hypothetical protein
MTSTRAILRPPTWLLGLSLGLAAAATFATPLKLDPARASTPPSSGVDLFLVLAVDVSGSISYAEKDFQRQSYARVLRDPAIMSAIASGQHGGINLAYFEWAGVGQMDLVVPPMHIDDRADLEEIARQIENPSNRSLPPGTNATAIGEALAFAEAILMTTPLTANRIVIDVSGDGYSSHGVTETVVRDRLVYQGVTINGLPLLYDDDPADDQLYLAQYYADCVIGGPMSFTIPVRRQADFQEGLRRKMLLEIAGSMPKPPSHSLPLHQVFSPSCLTDPVSQEF